MNAKLNEFVVRRLSRQQYLEAAQRLGFTPISDLDLLGMVEKLSPEHKKIAQGRIQGMLRELTGRAS